MNELDEQIARVREFNRFYTKLIGVLQDGLVQTPHTLTEARVIFELAQDGSGDGVEVTELRRTLELDAGYLSRILAKLADTGLIKRERSSADARRQVVRLTKKGGSAFDQLDQHTVEQINGLLEKLEPSDRRTLLAAMRTISGLLGDPPPARSIVLREPHPGELGWVVGRNGAVYAEEYGWDETYEALVARIVAEFVERRDPKRERAWIAEVDGEPAGCVFCVRANGRADALVAKLRLLLVDPRFRGLGVGGRLVDEVLGYARRVGYRRITLWTNDVLRDARRIYQRAGFELVKEERHTSFGKELVGQDWARDL
jgi:DNA-binding MarR family transcriptional regulator/GNAT superfamily N-acetyltransferase